MLPEPFAYIRPTSLEAALDVLAELGDDASPYAGGTELMLVLKLRLARYETLVDLKRIVGLDDIAAHGSMLSIGAMATHATIASHPDVNATVPALAKLCHTIANPRVRSVGTIGGNLCFAEPRADPPTVLAALDAQLQLLSKDGHRTIPADQFIKGPLETERRNGEILTRIDINHERYVVRYERQLHGHRSLVGAAAAIPTNSLDRARIWLGCAAEQPIALENTEQLLSTGEQAVDLMSLQTAVASDVGSISVIGDEDASADYRAHIATIMTTRAVIGAMQAVSREVRV